MYVCVVCKRNPWSAVRRDRKAVEGSNQLGLWPATRWQPGLLRRLVFKRLSTYYLEVWYVLASLMATGCLFSDPISWRVGSLSHCPGWLEPKDSLSACDSLIPRGFAWLLIFLTISRKSKPLPFIHLLFIIYLLKRSPTSQRQRTREEPHGDRGCLFCELPP